MECYINMSNLKDLPRRTTLFPPHFIKKKVVVNALPLGLLFQNIQLYLYQAVYDPPVPDTQWGREVQQYANTKIQNLLANFSYVRKDRLMSWTLIPEGKKEIKMVYQNDPYLLTLSLKRTINFNSYLPRWESESCLAYLNKQLRSMLTRLNYTQYNAFCFKPEVKSVNKYLKMHFLQGYRTHFEFINHRLHLIINPVSKMIRQTSLLQEINTVYIANSSLTKEEKRQLIVSSFRNKSVMACYGGKQMYRINEIIFDLPADQIYFSFKGTKCTIVQYYQIKYGLKVTSKAQPIVKTQISFNKYIYLLPEFLRLCENTNQLSLEMKEQMHKESAVSPMQSYSMTNNLVEDLRQIQQDHPLLHLVPFGMVLEHDLVEMESVVLEYPRIKVGRNQYVDEFKPNSFGLSSKQLYKTNIPLNITVICPNHLNMVDLKEYSQAVAGNLGLTHSLSIFTLYYQFENKGLREERAIKQIKTILQLQKSSKVSAKTNIFWVIIPDSFSNLYSKIKEISLHPNIQLPTQVTFSSTMGKKGLMEIYTSIFIQMAAKVGNRPWIIENEDYPSEGILIIGISQANLKEERKLIGYCSNTAPDGSQLHSNYIVIEQTQSLSMKIRQLVQTSLDEYTNHSQHMPREIVILRRDKLTKRNYMQIQAEVRQIREVIWPIVANRYLGLRYYLLNFQSDLRFYYSKRQTMVNPLQGTLVNVDRYCLADFYMITRQGNCGLSPPLHFVPVFNASDYAETDMQRFLYETSFQYYNKTGKVDVPAMLRYAQKLTKGLAQCDLRRKSIEELKQTLFYL